MNTETVRAHAKFTLSILKRNNDEESIVFSPFSIGLTLSILHLGAQGDTKRELERALLDGCGSDEDKRNPIQHYSGLRDELLTADDTVQVKHCNKLLIDQNCKVKNDYTVSLRQLFNTEAKACCFSKPDVVVKEINSLCQLETNGKIQEILTKDMISPATSLLLIDIIYFKGGWQTPFSESSTRPEVFYGTMQKREESFMWAQGPALINFSNADVQVLSLPYKTPSYKMYFFLPKEGLGLKEWIESTNQDELLELMHGVRLDLLCETIIPRFTVKKTLQLEKSLREMGINEIFGQKANLQNISEDPIHVSKILHKTYLEINEKGTEAAAVTVVTGRFMETCSRGDMWKPKLFHANRPFLYLLTHQDAIIFCGTFC